MEHRKEHGKVILSFHGSRSLDGPEASRLVEKILKEKNPDTVVTHGEPGGICRLAREECRRLGIPLKLYFLKKEHARGMYHHRSLAVLKGASEAIFIHDGESKGTQNEIEMANDLNVPYEYYKLNPEGIESWSKVKLDLDVNLDI